MEKIVIIGANEFQNPLILKAKEMGFQTHVFAWKAGDIGEKTADFFYPISIVEKEAILKECEKIKPSAVVSIGSDLAVLTVTYLCEKLGLNSNKEIDSAKCTNKYEMRKALKAAGLTVPGFEKVKSVTELTDLTFPKIVKPTDRSGSRSISLVNNIEELSAAIFRAVESSFEKYAIVEDVISGNNEYSCESISFEGKHSIIALTQKYTTGFPKCIEKGHVQPADLSEKAKKNIATLIPVALDALNIKFGPSHTEFIVDKDDNVTIVEIGARMGGDCIGSHLVQLSTGKDYLGMTIDCALGKQPDFAIQKKYAFSFIKFIFCQSDIEKAERLINNKDFELIAKSDIQEFNHEVVDSSSRFGYYIFSTNNKKALDDIIDGGFYE